MTTAAGIAAGISGKPVENPGDGPWVGGEHLGVPAQGDIAVGISVRLSTNNLQASHTDGTDRPHLLGRSPKATGRQETQILPHIHITY